MVPAHTHITISLVLSLVGTLAAGLAYAEVGTITHVSGPLFATKANGTQKALTPRSAIDSGDTLFTTDNTYARIKFVDEGEVTLRPNTQFKVEDYHYNPKKPAEGNSFFSLIKGGLRAISGFIGQRGSPDKYRMDAASATIGIRGTVYGANLCQGGSCAGVPDGLYVDVSQGSVVVSNAVGSQQLDAGQFGYVQNLNSKPIVLPADPGVKFTPPPAFNSKGGTGTPSGGLIGSGPAGGCEVH
jgi:hypothetical protein